jgi:hypothetical protein
VQQVSRLKVGKQNLLHNSFEAHKPSESFQGLAWFPGRDINVQCVVEKLKTVLRDKYVSFQALLTKHVIALAAPKGVV